ncbi:MAG: DUF2889 domain-containing protein [Oxalobacter sp.]|nr:MAG: DUF2889 domain-containing protein [Oxalobacter sp.]
MPLPPATARILAHARAYSVEIFRREDGLWDIDARLTDTKTREVQLKSKLLPPHHPLHDVLLRLTVDTEGHVIDATAVLDAIPFLGFCDTIDAAYKKLIGLNVLSDFRQAVRERFAGVAGCAHLNELALILPDVAILVLPFEHRKELDHDTRNKKPFELDNCHALRTDGPAVALYYPRWVVTSTK